MAARANSVTDRARMPPPGASGSWSMPGRDVRVFADGLARLGFDAPALLSAAGLRDADLADPDARVSCEAMGTLVWSAESQRLLPNIGLELARVTPLGAYPLLDYLVVTSDTVAAGVDQLARYMRLVGNPVWPEPRVGTDGVRVQLHSPSPGFGVEFLASLMVLHLRHETDNQFTVTAVDFEHVPDDVARFERLLACPVHPSSSWSGLTLPIEAWHLPLRRRDPILRTMLEAHADEVLSREPSRAGISREVQRALAQDVLSGDVRIETIARALAMSGRTLQRRLAAEGVSFQELLDEARKDAAARYLRERTLSVCEVAYLVGYSEPAPFHRAFKRWYGTTPEVFRKDMR
jgi:AraC-like DNA-binding protein